jgi:hypothetical protein
VFVELVERDVVILNVDLRDWTVLRRIRILLQRHRSPRIVPVARHIPSQIATILLPVYGYHPWESSPRPTSQHEKFGIEGFQSV